ncbi:helix-turn-helix domain-containing protein [Streptomonospora nanhaiensis]|uniref:helix-turn-helix domain-containing protein n=1 Tax=Streptomonospora nanhaiensis TaxID=1323731 RepID=UPI001C3830F0|nr:helix-turn-helix domain-containing protein [Streptomonospora nanhaiensis]
MSPRTSSPACSRPRFGTTPTAYLAMLRVQEMARLLRETHRRCGSRAAAGWRSRSRATEAFLAHTGIAPSRYRDMRPFVADVP